MSLSWVAVYIDIGMVIVIVGLIGYKLMTIRKVEN